MLQRAISLRVIATLLVFLTQICAAQAANKYALLIGINDYQSIPSLSKAVGDARSMAAALQQIGYDIVLVENADRRTLNRAISRFREKLKPGDIAFVHYSGHGIEINGRNYLLASDIPKPTSAAQDEIEGEAFSVANLINRISSTGAGVRIFVLDACRDNPFAASGTRSVGTKRGLTREKVTAGTFVFYSAGYGQSALDNLGDADTSPTSVYTRVLAEKLLQPYSHIAEVARDVRRKVEKLALSIGHHQRPAYYDELSDDFCFVCKKDLVTNDSASPASENTAVSGEAMGPFSETNSRSSNSGSNETGGTADLVIRSVELKATGKCKVKRPVMNGRIEVENIGTATAGTPQNPVIVSIRDTHDKAKKWSNGTRLGVIKPGETRTGYFPLHYFAGLPGHIPGLHEFEVTVDSQKTVKELNEENNTAYGEIEIKCPSGNIASNDNHQRGNNSVARRMAALPNGGARSYWDHNGSLMYLTAEGTKRAFFYQNPRRIVREAGVRDGTLLFYGRKIGRSYIGKMRQFSKYCGTVEYNVRGFSRGDSQGIRVKMTGKVPIRSKKDCRTIGHKTESYIFSYLYAASTQARQRKRPANIVRQVPRFRPFQRKKINQHFPDENTIIFPEEAKQKYPINRNADSLFFP